MVEPEKLAIAVTCHAWNTDRSRLAYCPNNNEIHIARKEGDSWVTESVLKEHDQTVTGIDWAPRTNRLVTCSQDRNAYVWTEIERGSWKPTLVILRLQRAATHVKWSPEENKFAVASGAKCVSVCYFEEDNDWWVSKHIKKHKSTVLQVDWHPNNILLATGSSDYKARIFSAFIKNVDKRPEPSPWGDKVSTFGNLMGEFAFANGWVHTVAWSPSGNRLAFAAHDSTLNFVEASSGSPQFQQLLLQSLPFRDIKFLNENTVIGVGHDCNPQLFSYEGSQWVVGRQLDGEAKKEAKSVGGTKMAFQKFQTAVDKGTKDGELLETTLKTKHQNCINCIRPFRQVGANITEFTTSGLDGQLCFWAL